MPESGEQGEVSEGERDGERKLGREKRRELS